MANLIGYTDKEKICMSVLFSCFLVFSLLYFTYNEVLFPTSSSNENYTILNGFIECFKSLTYLLVNIGILAVIVFQMLIQKGFNKQRRELIEKSIGNYRLSKRVIGEHKNLLNHVFRDEIPSSSIFAIVIYVVFIVTLHVYCMTGGDSKYVFYFFFISAIISLVLLNYLYFYRPIVVPHPQNNRTSSRTLIPVN